MGKFQKLIKKSHVKSHPLFTGRDANISAMRANMSKASQELNLNDIFSQKRQMGIGRTDKTLNSYIQEAALTARASLDVLNFPMFPQLNFNNAKYVKYSSYDPTQVIDAEILFNIRIATLTGSVRQAVMPISIVSGMVVPPSILLFEGRPRIISQSTVDEIVQRNTSYALEPMRGQFDPPLDGEELDIKVLERYDMGYQPREIDMDNQGVRRTYRRNAQIMDAVGDLAHEVDMAFSGAGAEMGVGVDEHEWKLANDVYLSSDGTVEDFSRAIAADPYFRSAYSLAQAPMQGVDGVDVNMPMQLAQQFIDSGVGFQAQAGVDKEWEPTVKKMKDHPEIDNPWALAKSMDNKGYTPGGEKGSYRGTSNGKDAYYDPEDPREEFEVYCEVILDPNIPMESEDDRVEVEGAISGFFLDQFKSTSNPLIAYDDTRVDFQETLDLDQVAALYSATNGGLEPLVITEGIALRDFEVQDWEGDNFPLDELYDWQQGGRVEGKAAQYDPNSIWAPFYDTTLQEEQKQVDSQVPIDVGAMEAEFVIYPMGVGGFSVMQGNEYIGSPTSQEEAINLINQTAAEQGVVPSIKMPSGQGDTQEQQDQLVPVKAQKMDPLVDKYYKMYQSAGHPMEEAIEMAKEMAAKVSPTMAARAAQSVEATDAMYNQVVNDPMVMDQIQQWFNAGSGGDVSQNSTGLARLVQAAVNSSDLDVDWNQLAQTMLDQNLLTQPSGYLETEGWDSVVARIVNKVK